VRRKFVDAQKASPREAHEAVARIRQLYEIERTAKEQKLTDTALSAYRLEHAKPLLDAFADWLETQRVKVIPRTPLAEAIGYAVNQWSTLTVYVRDGRLAIDNNIAERAIKPFAIGRKNWLFFGSDRGGRILATLASFTATCQQFGVEPWRWLRDTLTALPTTPADQLATLLPTKTKQHRRSEPVAQSKRHFAERIQKGFGRTDTMVARRRKTLVVCQRCHEDIHRERPQRRKKKV
jgi:hypothetical protein